MPKNTFYVRLIWQKNKKHLNTKISSTQGTQRYFVCYTETQNQSNCDFQCLSFCCCCFEYYFWLINIYASGRTANANANVIKIYVCCYRYSPIRMYLLSRLDYYCWKYGHVKRLSTRIMTMTPSGCVHRFVMMCMVIYFWSYTHEHTIKRQCLDSRLQGKFSALYFHPANDGTETNKSSYTLFTIMVYNFIGILFTKSWMVESQSGCANRILMISMRPCSAAHINAVLPSSSWILISAPASSSIRTILKLPCDVANI